MSTLGVGTAYPRNALEIVATRTKPLPDLLDALKAIPAVGGRVLLIVYRVQKSPKCRSKIVWSSLRPRGTYRFPAVVATEIAELT